jgi:hypothetical protein
MSFTVDASASVHAEAIPDDAECTPAGLDDRDITPNIQSAARAWMSGSLDRAAVRQLAQFAAAARSAEPSSGTLALRLRLRNDRARIEAAGGRFQRDRQQERDAVGQVCEVDGLTGCNGPHEG